MRTCAASVTVALALLFVMTRDPMTEPVHAQARTPAGTWAEATVADIHRALAAREVTCRQVVQAYLDRIEAYDRRGPAIRALITVNARALDEADRLDRESARGATPAPLHCIPLILKDNFDTADMPTTGASGSGLHSPPVGTWPEVQYGTRSSGSAAAGAAASKARPSEAAAVHVFIGSP